MCLQMGPLREAAVAAARRKRLRRAEQLFNGESGPGLRGAGLQPEARPAQARADGRRASLLRKPEATRAVWLCRRSQARAGAETEADRAALKGRP